MDIFKNAAYISFIRYRKGSTVLMAVGGNAKQNVYNHIIPNINEL